MLFVFQTYLVKKNLNFNRQYCNKNLRNFIYNKKIRLVFSKIIVESTWKKGTCCAQKLLKCTNLNLLIKLIKTSTSKETTEENT